mgnify:CR=1 FL=1
MAGEAFGQGYEAAGMPVRGNFGVRVVDTSVVSKGLRAELDVVNNSDGSIRLVETGAFDDTRIKASSFRVLPSVNANFDLTPKTVGRIALYRAMSRPAPSSLAAGRTITLQDGSAERTSRITAAQARALAQAFEAAAHAVESTSTNRRA